MGPAEPELEGGDPITEVPEAQLRVRPLAEPLERGDGRALEAEGVSGGEEVEGGGQGGWEEAL